MDPACFADAVLLSGFQYGHDAGAGDGWADGAAIWCTGMEMEKDTARVSMLHTESSLCGCIFNGQVGKL